MKKSELIIVEFHWGIERALSKWCSEGFTQVCDRPRGAFSFRQSPTCDSGNGNSQQ